LFCHDGSKGSAAALKAAGALVMRPVEAVVLTVWQPVAVQLALTGAFAAGAPANEGELDSEEAANARAVAEEGARLAREHGYDARAMLAQADEGVARAILQVADDLDARLIVCGQRGRGLVRSALLGSVSHALSSHARRPILIAPEPRNH
jgi:nucleotide-binding universal stress UspA family protein